MLDKLALGEFFQLYVFADVEVVLSAFFGFEYNERNL
jgi:hypothetical protein